MRTRYCIPGSVFLVEGLQAAPISKSGRWQAVQLLLGDGQLCIQALLAAPLHRFVEKGDVAVGAYVRLGRFRIRWERIDVTQAERVGGAAERSEGKELAEEMEDDTPRHMVYLVVDDLVTIGWNDHFLEMWRSQVQPPPAEPTPSPRKPSKLQVHAEAAESTANKAKTNVLAKEAGKIKASTGSQRQITPRKKTKHPVQSLTDTAVEDAFESFDTLTFPLKMSPRKNQRAQKQDTTPNQKQQQTRPPAANATDVSPSKRPSVALPRDWHDLQTPLKLTTLRSIPHLPYAQNWSCNVLAIVASLSPAVEPSHLPPYRQRTARIADPSTAKQVHLTIFLDPEAFDPKVGSAVLLVGVKNHRFDGGSLKKYASDGAKGTKWWYEDPWELAWCDVAGIKEWWSQMGKAAE
jgi:hypothetical protein